MPAHQQHDAVDRRRQRVEVVLDPSSRSTNGTSDSQNSRCRFAHSDSCR